MTELDHSEDTGKRPGAPNLTNGGQISTNGVVGEPRAVHDGFATIRAGGGKRGRCRSSPSVAPEHKSCPGCGGTSPGMMEPLWEERTAPGVTLHPEGVPQRRQRNVPWWEVATRRSKYRSCPAFSQANVVSALEQTVTNLTSQLERLVSSPDLKEAQAEELRRSAAVLREQSSAVYQSINSSYFTMERQLSCDSVSSVTSTASGASLASYVSLGPHHCTVKGGHHHHNHHHHSSSSQQTNNHHHHHNDDTKNKKRNWLRSSFRRAFSRRKRNKPGECEVPNSSNQANPNPSESIHQNGIIGSTTNSNHSIPVNNYSKTVPRPPSNKAPHHPPQRSIFAPPLTNGVHRTAIDELRHKLLNKEQELTDCQLELLSVKHVIQTNEDTINRLQVDVSTLKAENTRLGSLLKCDNNIVSNDTLMTPITQAMGYMTIGKNNNSNSAVRSNTGRRVRIIVENEALVTHGLSTGINSSSNGVPVPVGSVIVCPGTTWQQLDDFVIEALRNFCLRVDPGTGLGVSGLDVFCYNLGEVTLAEDLPRPDLLPYGYCVGSVDQIQIWLKNGHQKSVGASIGNVALCSFHSVIPGSWLRQLMGSLEETRRLVLSGPPAAGKSSLAQTLAKLYVTSAGLEANGDTIITFTVTGSNTLDLCQLLSSVWPHGLKSDRTGTHRSRSSDDQIGIQNDLTANHVTPLVIIIDDLHAAGGVVETLQRCLPSSNCSGPAIIATSHPMPSLSTRIHLHCSFRWINLCILQEPLRGLLGRTIRRNIAITEERLGTSLPKAHHTSEWLTQLWLHINTLLNTHISSDAVLGPGIFTQCPVDQSEAQTWFLQIWNNSVVPKLLHMIESSLNLVLSWTDPVDWIMSSYPWIITAAFGPNQLLKIPSNEISHSPPVTNRSISSTLRSYQLSSNWQPNRALETIYATPVTPAVGVTEGSVRPISTTPPPTYASLSNLDYREITIKPTISMIKSSINPPNKPNTLTLTTTRDRTHSVSSTSSSSYTSSTVKSRETTPTSDCERSLGENPTDDTGNCISTTKGVFNPLSDEEMNIGDLFSLKSDNLAEEFPKSDVELNNLMNSNPPIKDSILILTRSNVNKIKDVSEDLTSTFKSI